VGGHSDWHDWHGTGWTEDRLDNPGWLERFAASWDLQVGASYTARARQALGELRTLARRMVDDFRAGRPLSDADVAALNAYLAKGPARRQFRAAEGKPRVVLVPATRNWDWVVAETAASLANLLARGEPDRLKACENRDCGWIFYDESRNRSRRWCDSRACGNLIKVRRFRARRKSERGPGR